MTENSDTDDDTRWMEFEDESPKKVLEIRDGDPYIGLHGYDTDSDHEASLCCSECGEAIEAVVTQRESEFLFSSIPQIEGFICGCSHTPETWTARSLGTDAGTENREP